MNNLPVLTGAVAVLLLAEVPLAWAQQPRVRLSPLEELGKRLFYDPKLSSPRGQACAVCHGPAVGFSGPDDSFNRTGGVYEGAVQGRFGNRKPPASAYAGDSPPLHQDKNGAFVGGMFWDGRATGQRLGDPLAEQALGPFLNPLEQNQADKKSVVLAVKQSDYAAQFERVWGPGSLTVEPTPDAAYDRIGRAIAAYERSAEVNPFSSRFDDFWRAATARGLKVETVNQATMNQFKGLGLTPVELQGLMLFNTSGRCANCHLLKSVNGKPPVFTDFKYDNAGIPPNPDNPFYAQPPQYNPAGAKWVDLGLGGYLKTVDRYKPLAVANYGRQKTPTLRNVDRRPSPQFVKAYMHNAFFKSLKEVVRFYNTRDLPQAHWPAPEVAANLNRTDIGNLGLTAAEEDALVDFLKTLSDRP